MIAATSNEGGPVKPRRRLRVLMSAIACSPRRGSEDGMGWRWAVEVSRRGHSVTVLTRRAFRAEIESEADTVARLGIRFIYIDLFSWVDYRKTPDWLSYIYIYIWQAMIFFSARHLHKTDRFDIVHHITFAGIRFPSFLGFVGPPFIIGPLGGGEAAPKRLREGYPGRGRIVEAMRDLSNSLVRYDPMMRLTFSSARRIFLCTRETMALLPAPARPKAVVAPATGANPEEIGALRAPRRVDGPLRVLFVGRMLYWKGVHIALEAVARARASVDLRFTCVGSGPDISFFRDVATRLGLDDVEWRGELPKTAMKAIYDDHHVFLFPSLHDSGAMVIYEAAGSGMPIVCLRLGFAREIPVDDFGVAVDADAVAQNEVTAAIADALVSFARDRSRIDTLGARARAWAKSVVWSERVAAVYGDIERSVVVS